MQEREGVRVGQRVRDLDGTSLGRVTHLFDWAFAARRGLWLFRSDYVLRYDEVRGVRDGEILVDRSSRDLFDLAAGGIPPSWRVATPPEFPTAATPPEARLLLRDLARRAIATDAAPRPAPAIEPPPADAPPTEDEEREYVRTRGQSVPAQPPR
jgi:hypothetical protein